MLLKSTVTLDQCIDLLKSRRLHGIFLHFNHPYNPLLSTRVECYSLLGGGVSDVLRCLWFICNLGGLCSSYLCIDFLFQGFSCFPSCLQSTKQGIVINECNLTKRLESKGVRVRVVIRSIECCSLVKTKQKQRNGPITMLIVSCANA